MTKDNEALKKRVNNITFFDKDIMAFYVSLFPQLDMSEEEEEEFISQVDENALLEGYCSSLLEKYGEEELYEVVDVLESFFDNCGEAFGVVPAELDRWLSVKHGTSTSVH